MKRSIIVAVLVVSWFMPSRLLEAQLPQPPLDPRVVEWDKGPSKIDVSKYPPEMKHKYKVVEDLCGTRCHPLARAINCDFALEDDWERYIKRMMRRGKGLITSSDAMQVYEFMVYDSKVRKKDLYEQKMAARQ